MPAKKLSPEQTAEAARLKRWFKEKQAERKRNGGPWTQEEIADELGWTQSGLNQYLGGQIPLNRQAVLKFSKMLGRPPNEISPTVVAQVSAQAAAAAAFLGETIPARPTPRVREKLMNPPSVKPTKTRGPR